jgi:hypothetical protein
MATYGFNNDFEIINPNTVKLKNPPPTPAISIPRSKTANYTNPNSRRYLTQTKLGTHTTLNRTTGFSHDEQNGRSGWAGKGGRRSKKQKNRSRKQSKKHYRKRTNKSRKH